MKKFLVFICLIVSHLRFSQQDCLCSQNFDFAYLKIKDNYAGWGDKITPKNQAEFDKLTQEIREAAKKITNERECYFLQKKWFDFFKDGHLFISPITPYTIDDAPEVVVSQAPKVPQLAFNRANFMQYLKENEANL